MALLLLTGAGCGELHFVPAPYTPQDVELIFSEQEQITIVRWRVSADPPLSHTRFELLGDDGYRPIDFSTSVYAGGVNACVDGSGACAQFVVRGRYTVAKGVRPLRAVDEAYGVLPGEFGKASIMAETFAAKSFFRPHNDMVYFNITDAVAGGGAYAFPRPYERAMWPTSGLCVSDTLPDGVSFSPLDATGGFPPATPLTDEGMYCVATRPVPTDGGDAVIVQVRIATVPEVVTKTQVYRPAIERSPIIYQLVLDLEIPVPDRCEEVVRNIEDFTNRYMKGGGVSVHKLPTLNLAENGSSRCAQTNGRTVPATEMAQAVKQLVTTLPGVHQQYHLMYFNNLDAPLPTPFVTSMQTLLNATARSPAGYELQTFSWIFNPGTAQFSQLSWWAFWVWKTADESFQIAMEDYGRTALPYTTQFHDPGEPVLLLAPEELTAYEGHLIKICSSSPGIQPVGTQPFEHFISTASWPISSADPPSYLVTLNNQVVVKSSEFVASSAIVNYQICTRYCRNHPYVTTNGTGETSWEPSFSCASEQY